LHRAFPAFNLQKEISTPSEHTCLRFMPPIASYSNSRDSNPPPDATVPFLSVLSPCYRDQDNVAELHRRLTAACESLNIDYEILLVDDGSPDLTWNEILRIAQIDTRLRGIRLSRNYGHQIAVSAGLVNVRGQRVLIIDSDLQDPPELLPQMMARMDAGSENVYGCRKKRRGTALWKRACYKLFYKILSLLAGCSIPEDAGDFRLISRRVVDAINSMPEQHRFLRGMISWTGFSQAPVYYDRDPRFAGHSGYTLTKLLHFAADGITSFSIKPLRLATFLGMTTGVFCLAFAAYVAAGTFLYGQPVAGWASLIVAILFVGSLQLFVLGIIGEYLGRLFVESKARPLFIVSEETGGK
jgi:polyisoprenyl-phosphate glycosyltransferase